MGPPNASEGDQMTDTPDKPCAGEQRDPRREAGARRPARTRLMSESDVDGFSSDEPKLEVYCSLDGCKFGLEAHEMCAYFERFVYSEQGEVIGIRCARPDDDIEYPLAGTDDC
jgi:hypothetical protein